MLPLEVNPFKLWQKFYLSITLLVQFFVTLLGVPLYLNEAPLNITLTRKLFMIFKISFK